MSAQGTAVAELRAVLHALPLHPSPAAWQALADACERVRAYALGRIAGAEGGCSAVGPAARGCILGRHIGHHVDARGKPFG